MPNAFQVQDQILKDFNKRLTKVVTNFKRKVVTNLTLLETSGSRLTASTANIEYATALLPQLLQDLQDAGFGDIISGLLDDDVKLIKSLKSLSPIPLEFTQTSVQTIAALQSAQIASFNAIGEQAVNRIREEVMRTVLTGAPIEDAITAISDSLESQFQRYAYTYANTALRDSKSCVNRKHTKHKEHCTPIIPLSQACIFVSHDRLFSL